MAMCRAETLRLPRAQSFDIACRRKIATGFHVESRFWFRCTDLLANLVNVEARDWSGTPSTGPYLHRAAYADSIAQAIQAKLGGRRIASHDVQVVRKLISLDRPVALLRRRSYCWGGSPAIATNCAPLNGQ